MHSPADVATTCLANPSVAGSLVVVTVAVAGLVAAERRGSWMWRGVCKPIASTAFVALGGLTGGMASPYGRCVMVALALGWLGDVLLLGRSKCLFLLGLGSFLLGHAAFGAGFVARGIAWPEAALAATALVVPLGALWRWLGPSVPGSMRAPVIAYFAVIGAMVALATGTASARGGWVVPVAAVMFALSDVSVARDRFIGAGWVNKAWGLPLYYAAQCILALTAAP